MVSVILGILKLIGLILLGILGLILLLVFLVLLVPIRLKICGSFFEKKPKGRTVASWLLHIISVQAAYEEKLDLAVRIFGIRVGPRTTGEEGAPDKEGISGQEGKPDKEGISGWEGKPGREGISGREGKPDKEGISGREGKPDREGMSGREGKLSEPGDEKESAGQPEAGGRLEEGSAVSGKRKPRFSFRRICDRLKSGIRRIKEKLDKLWQKVLELREKKEQVQAFFQKEENRATIRLAKRQALKIVKHILPRKMEGRVRFGFDDPYTTGQVLTYISPFYGLYADKLELVPVFEEPVLEGELQLKGRIRIGTVLAAAARMLFDRNFRKILKKLWKA